MTRYERLKAMSLDELAEFLYDIEGEPLELDFCRCLPECNELLDEDKNPPREACLECMRRWLCEDIEEGQDA